MEKQDIFWHELTNEQQNTVAESGIILNTFMKIFSQPKWCKYPDALQGYMGCWSLMKGKVHGINDCKDCEECNTHPLTQ